MRLLVFAIGFLLLSAGSNVAPSNGEQAPDFELTTPEGKKLTLKKFSGKMVLLDFWASWCRPCRHENPNVVEAYNKYNKSKFENGKGFEVISVSLDKQESAWVQAIEKDGLIWKSHGWDHGGTVSRLYGVASIPTAFLIDGDGKIVASGRELRGLGLHLTLDKYLAK